MEVFFRQFTAQEKKYGPEDEDLKAVREGGQNIKPAEYVADDLIQDIQDNVVSSIALVGEHEPGTSC
jgi:hypothetical protein